MRDIETLDSVLRLLTFPGKEFGEKQFSAHCSGYPHLTAANSRGSRGEYRNDQSE